MNIPGQGKGAVRGSQGRPGGGMSGAGAAEGPGGTPRQGGNSDDPNDPQGAVSAFLTALANQDQEALAGMIASKAQGDLKALREGKLEAQKLTKMADRYGKLQVVTVARVSKGDERTVVIGEGTDSKKGRQQVIVRKEEGAWKVFKL